MATDANDLIADVETFLANGGELMSDYFLDEKARLWLCGQPVLGVFTDEELRAVYGDNWRQAATRLDTGLDAWKE